MRVELHLPDKVWAEALDVAEKNFTTVARVIEAAIKDALRPSTMARLEAQARQNHVLQAWGEGLTDAAIAERTGEVKQYVSETRRKAGLPPNRVGQSPRTSHERNRA